MLPTSTRAYHDERMQVRNYRLVIFDSDGTLADTLPWMRSVFNELADEHGFRKVAAEKQEEFRDLHGAALLKALELPLWKLPRVVNGMRKKMAAHAGEFRPFPGISEMLQQLSDAGIQLGVVSSNSQPNVERVLGAQARLIKHFECGVSMFGKAAKIRAVVRKSGVAALETIYVGDEIRDGEASRKAGVAFGAVTWGQHSAEALKAQQPAHLFQSPSEIAAAVLRARNAHAV
jgi:phosphoglycolate phosphatase